MDINRSTTGLGLDLNNADFNVFSGIRMSQLLDLNGFVNEFDNSSNIPSTSTFQSFQNQLLSQSQLFQNNNNQHNNQGNQGNQGNQSIQQNIINNSGLNINSNHQPLPPPQIPLFNQLLQQQQNNQQNQNNHNNNFNQQNMMIDLKKSNPTTGLFGTNDYRAELKELFNSLQSLSQESLQHLFFLSRALQPQVTEDLRFALITKMFADVPKMIDQVTSSNLHAYATDTSNHAFRLFLDFKELSNMLGRVSYMQLFQLTNNLIAPGTPQSQFTLLQRIQEYFQRCSTEQLRLFNHTIEQCGGGVLGNQRLLQIDPSISVDITHFVAGIVSLPIDELNLFHQWFSVLPKKMLAVLLAILQLESATVLDLKRILASSSLPPLPFINHHQQQQIHHHNNHNNNSNQNINIYNVNENQNPSIIVNNNNSSSSQNQQQSNTTPLISSEFSVSLPPLFPNLNLSTSINSLNPTSTTSTSSTAASQSNSNNNNNDYPPSSPSKSPAVKSEQSIAASLLSTSASSILASSTSTDDCSFYLKIARQPPPTTVYQRILKPFPSVMLCGPGVENANLSNFFVEASLLRNDNQVELPTCLDGNKISRISNGTFAPFKKLKILSTTMQQRTLFRLKFVLKRYIGNDFQTISKASVLSDPIEVFSHTIYLADKQDVPLPPTVTEVIPSQGPSNTRMVVLGNNFVKSENLSVQFGPMMTAGQFYEKGTIICNAPERAQTVKSGSPVYVNVANDGEQYSTDNISFTYTR